MHFFVILWRFHELRNAMHLKRSSRDVAPKQRAALLLDTFVTNQIGSVSLLCPRGTQKITVCDVEPAKGLGCLHNVTGMTSPKGWQASRLQRLMRRSTIDARLFVDRGSGPTSASASAMASQPRGPSFGHCIALSLHDHSESL